MAKEVIVYERADGTYATQEVKDVWNTEEEG